jgi:hypothetical protein
MLMLMYLLQLKRHHTLVTVTSTLSVIHKTKQPFQTDFLARQGRQQGSKVDTLRLSGVGQLKQAGKETVFCNIKRF